MNDDLVTVETVRFLPDAEYRKMRLEAEGVSVFLADAETVAMDWFLGNAIGFIKLQVPRSQAEAAMTVLQQIHAERESRENEPEKDEAEICLACKAEMPEDAEKCPACGWSYGSERD